MNQLNLFVLEMYASSLLMILLSDADKDEKYLPTGVNRFHQKSSGDSFKINRIEIFEIIILIE